MTAIRRLIGYIILNTDAVEIVVVCGLLIVWMVAMAVIRAWKKRK